MHDYPAHYESDILLQEGSTIHLRPIKPDDARRLMELHSRLSPRSIYFRFFRPLPQLSEERAASFANVDYNDTFALIAELAGRLIGVAPSHSGKKTNNTPEITCVN